MIDNDISWSHKTEFKSGTFYLGDCLDVMTTLEPGSVDMVVTSPPYDNLRTYNDGDAWTFEVFKGVATTISRVIKPGGVIVWNVADATVRGSETGTSFRQALYFKDECGLNLHDTMIWQKSTFSAVGSLQTRYAPVFEYMFVFCKGRLATFNPIKDRPNKHAGVKHHGTVRQKDGSTVSVAGAKAGKEIAEFGQRFNVWNVNEEKSANKDHPAVFPVAIPHDHILSWSDLGQIVLDPFAGSGTTAIAAINAGRKWICIERDEGYYEKAVQRIKHHEERLKNA